MAATIAETATNLVHVSFPIEKVEKDANGDLLVTGKATDGSVDSDEQIVDPDWSGNALKSWFDTGGNVRVQHQAMRDPAGKGLSLEITPDGHHVKSLVVEPVAKRLVESGVLRAYSIGIARPVIKRDPTGKARGGIVAGGEICEISLVDRPANKNCVLQLAKSEDGAPVLTGELTGVPADFLGKADDSDSTTAAAAVQDQQADGDSQGEDQADVRKAYEGQRAEWLQREPALKGALTGTEMLQQQASWRKWNHDGDESGLNGTSDGYRLWLHKRKIDPNVGGGTDRDKIPAEDFAGKDRSFPIVKPGDVSDAASSIGRAGAGNYSSDQLKANIIRIANRKGPSFVAELPDSWKISGPDTVKADDDSDGDSDSKKPCPTCKGDGKIMGGNRQCPDCKGSGVATPDTGKTADTVKAGGRSCKNCGKDFHADHPGTFCDSCGSKLPKVKKSKAGGGQMDTALAAMRDAVAKALQAGALTKETADVLLADAEAQVKAARPLPADAAGAATHREPDGTTTVEPLEADAGLGTDPDPIPDKVPASVKASTAPYTVTRMHDACCAAYPADTVLAAYPSLKTVTDAIDPAWFTTQAGLAAAAGKVKKTAWLAALGEAALTVKDTDPAATDDARAELHKAFTDLYPNTKLSPSDPAKPGSFQRPYLAAGHYREEPGGGPTIPPATKTPEPQDFRRGPLTDGHADPAPGSQPGPPIAPSGAAASRTYYTNTSRDSARTAMTALHDHIVGSFPEVCPMSASKAVLPPDLGAANVPVPTTPTVPGGVPGVGKGTTVLTVKQLAKAARRMGYTITPGMAMTPVPTPLTSAPAALTPDDVLHPAPGVDMNTLKGLLADQAKSITDSYAAQFTGLQQQVDQLGAQPDPNLAPIRTALARPDAPRPPAGNGPAAKTAGDGEEAAWREYVTALSHSPDPETREKAIALLDKMALAGPAR